MRQYESPVVVDLDGTLIKTDSLYECFIQLAFKQPVRALLTLALLLRGISFFKSALSKQISINFDLLPKNEQLLEWLVKQRTAGRRLILASAAEQSIAQKAADHFGLFEAALGSNPTQNLKGANKADAIERYLHSRDYCYVGDSRPDLKIWSKSSSAVVIGNSRGPLAKRASRLTTIETTFPREKPFAKSLYKQLRVHQWSKNILLFVPAISGHNLTFDNLLILTLGVLVFSVCASSVYLLNDLVDINNDRQHPSKKNRPLASGDVSIPVALVLTPILISIALTGAAALSLPLFYILAIYLVITLSYSFVLKKLPVVDVLTLALLYTVRIIAGALLIDHTMSPWLLSFSMFFFLSLALAKRYVEVDQAVESGASIVGRGYKGQDIAYINSIGTSSGMVSVFVLSLYLHSDKSAQLYERPEFLWCSATIMLFWISWIWFQANRRNLNEDPVIFALRDPISLCSGAFFVLFALLAASIPA